ncbi:D-inositol-3-phosphate glycosyltransferase [compost metagenome]
MVAVEAAAHGLQTVAYSSGGVVDAVADRVSGRLVASGHSEGFAQAVLALLADPIPAETIRGFAEDFSWRRFGERIKEAISDESC